VIESCERGTLIRDAALRVRSQQASFDGLQVLSPACDISAKKAPSAIREFVEELAALVDQSSGISHARSRALENQSSRTDFAE
jgi:hypothetical protein